jgi:hypothetical protein
MNYFSSFYFHLEKTDIFYQFVSFYQITIIKPRNTGPVSSSFSEFLLEKPTINLSALGWVMKFKFKTKKQ